MLSISEGSIRMDTAGRIVASLSSLPSLSSIWFRLEVAAHLLSLLVV